MNSEPVKIQREAIRRNGVRGLDITVKSAQGKARRFAPNWPMVMGSKSGEISWGAYTKAYHQILDRIPLEIWTWLHDQAEDGTLTVLCYCAADKPNCHTQLLIEYATDKYPALFQS